jgi:hypothetical protein
VTAHKVLLGLWTEIRSFAAAVVFAAQRQSKVRAWGNRVLPLRRIAAKPRLGSGL